MRSKKRRGVYRTTLSGAGLLNRGLDFAVAAEVIEIERIGRYSRVKVRNVSGAERRAIGSLIPTAAIEWEDT